MSQLLSPESAAQARPEVEIPIQEASPLNWFYDATIAHASFKTSVDFDDVPFAGFLVGASFFSPLVEASSTLLCMTYLTNHSALEAAVRQKVQPVLDGISTVHPASQETADAPSSTTELVSEIHDRSGLTWEQLAKALSVSKRSLHLWSAGARVSSKNLEALLSLRELLDSYEVAAPAAVRLLLLTPTASGISPLAAWAKALANDPNPVNAPTITPAQRLG